MPSRLFKCGSLLLACAASAAATAGPLGLYGPQIDKNSPACQTLGDAVSCSAPLLNYLAGLAPTTTVANGGYVLPSPQGALSSYIVVTTGGGAQANGDINPGPAAVEDGFKSNDVGSDSFFATGKANGTTVSAGNLSDPNNNSLAGGDNAGTWDVGIPWLLNALTINGTRRELVIGFDYNQPQSSTTSLNYWALVTLSDLNGVLPQVNFEIRSVTGQSYTAFTTDKSFASMPKSSDFGTVNGVTCIDTNGSEAIPILPQPGGNCPAGYETTIDNAQSTSDTEIFAFIPELNEKLADYASAGYDMFSTRLLMGCFGGTAQGSFKPGLGYLADETTGGATTHCESGGFGDVYLLAGAEMSTDHETPEPGTGALLGIALGALAWHLRRRSTRR